MESFQLPPFYEKLVKRGSSSHSFRSLERLLLVLMLFCWAATINKFLTIDDLTKHNGSLQFLSVCIVYFGDVKKVAR